MNPPHFCKCCPILATVLIAIAIYGCSGMIQWQIDDEPQPQDDEAEAVETAGVIRPWDTPADPW